MEKRKMIYAILDKSKGLVYFSDNERTEEELDFTELLYTSDLVSLSDIERDLRPWINLRSLERIYYKNVPELKEYLDTRQVHYSYNKISSQSIDKEIRYFLDDINFLDSLGCCNISPEPDEYELDEIKSNIKYDCDIYNYLEKRFGKDVVEIVFLYRSLDYDCKKFLDEFRNMGTRDKKSTYLRTSMIPKNNPEVLEFLPLWYRLDYKISYKKKNIVNLEFKNQEPLGDSNDLNMLLEKKIYDEFLLDNTYTGQEIKNKIQNIYSELGIEQTAKITDLQNYFEITKVNINNESSYRLDFRK